MSKPKASRKRSSKPTPWATVRVEYATAKSLDVTEASKRLRGKIRNAYGKDAVITKWIDRHDKTNRDGNRYGPCTAAERKAILSL
jgi:hypothetical protein